MTDFDRFKELYKVLEYSFEGIELNKVVAGYIWDSANGKKVFSWRHLIKFMFAYDVNYIKMPNENGFIATFLEGWRKEFYAMFCNIVDRLSISPTVTELYKLKNKKKIRFHPFIVIKIHKKVFSQLKHTNVSLWDKLGWASEYIFWCNTILELKKLNASNIKKYMCMCHVIGFENLLTQFFQQRGVETYSLQEGIYMVYKKNIVMGSIAYEVFSTDHLLCWGQYTKDEYVAYGISPSRISVAGYPNKVLVKAVRQNNKYRKVLVLLAGPIFGDVNMKLLNMLERLRKDFDVTLKSHPSNYVDMKEYAETHGFKIVLKAQSVNECLSTGFYDFTIAVNTTSYYESWMAGIPSFRYLDNRFDEFYGFDDFFTDESELIALINNYRSYPKSQDDIEQMLNYSIGIGVDNYNSIIFDNKL